jgi:hypothetical protein
LSESFLFILFPQMPFDLQYVQRRFDIDEDALSEAAKAVGQVVCNYYGLNKMIRLHHMVGILEEGFCSEFRSCPLHSIFMEHRI